MESLGEGKSVWRVLERVSQCGESWRGYVSEESLGEGKLVWRVMERVS